jgi:ABC-2 type transport system permease protein
MNRGVLTKALREAWPPTLVLSLALAVVEALLTYIIPTFFADTAAKWLELRFVREILKGLLGTEISDALGPGTITSIPWVHPIVLALVWTHAITVCTRMPAGEIDRGTIDMLLSLPVSRLGVYLCETVVWLWSGLVLIGFGLAGNWIAGRFVAPELQAAPSQLGAVAANFTCLYLAVGGVAWSASAMSDIRGRAVAVLVGFVLVSFLVNFLAQFADWAKRASILSVMHYYRPVFIYRDSSWPIADMVVLIGIGIAFWIIGAVVFIRRDICTV